MKYDDLKTAVRSLARRPALTLVTVVVLALGVGVDTAAFSVLDAVLLRPLPATEPDRLVYLVQTFVDRGGYYGVRYGDFELWRDASRSFSDLAAFDQRTFALPGDGGAERISGAAVTAGYFATLGVEPVLGRAFGADDFAAGERVVLLSSGYWRRRFGADPAVLGRTLVLDREPYRVIGVMPGGSRLPYLGGKDLWTPLARDEAPVAEQRWTLGVLGRLRDGVSLDDARRDLAAVAERRAAESPATNQSLGVAIHPVRWWIFGEVERPLLLVYAAAGLVLLVACGTAANLAFSRVVERRRDMAVRKALGAPGRLLFRQLLAESVAVALAGGLLGLALAWLAVEIVPGLVPDLPRVEEMAIDVRVLAAMLAVSIGAGIASGLAPSLVLAGTSPAALGGGRAGAGGRGGRRARRLLVASETALAVVAVIGAGLLVRSLASLTRVDPGFKPENLLTLKLELPADRFAEKESRITAVSELLERIEALPGVARAGASGEGVPLRASGGTFELYLEGRARGPRPDVVVRAQMVSEGYLEATGIELVAGRWFTAGETWETTHAVVVNETMARRYWPGEEPVGRWVEWQTGDRGLVAGVVGDARQAALHLEAEPEVYLAWGSVPATQTLAVRTASPEPPGLVARIREEAATVLPGVPLFAVATGGELVRESYADRRLWAMMVSAFAALALGLGLVGLYGVTACSVAGRTREIGIRMALGAWPRAVVRLVVGQGLAPVAAGTAAGMALALGLTRFLESQLFGVSGRDPVTFLLGAALILATATAVCALPARRASRIDPAVAVRGVD